MLNTLGGIWGRLRLRLCDLLDGQIWSPFWPGFSTRPKSQRFPRILSWACLKTESGQTLCKYAFLPFLFRGTLRLLFEGRCPSDKVFFQGLFQQHTLLRGMIWRLTKAAFTLNRQWAGIRLKFPLFQVKFVHPATQTGPNRALSLSRRTHTSRQESHQRTPAAGFEFRPFPLPSLRNWAKKGPLTEVSFNNLHVHSAGYVSNFIFMRAIK